MAILTDNITVLHQIVALAGRLRALDAKGSQVAVAIHGCTAAVITEAEGMGAIVDRFGHPDGFLLARLTLGAVRLDLYHALPEGAETDDAADNTGDE